MLLNKEIIKTHQRIDKQSPKIIQSDKGIKGSQIGEGKKIDLSRTNLLIYMNL